MKKEHKKIFIFFLIAAISLFLGYETQQIISPEKNSLQSAQEIIVEMEALPAPPTSQTPTPANGQSIYESHCAACHDTGATNAPKLGDKSAWAPRLTQNHALLLQHVLNGYNLMPPKGGCFQCSDNDLKIAVDYMIKKSK